MPWLKLAEAPRVIVDRMRAQVKRTFLIITQYEPCGTLEDEQNIQIQSFHASLSRNFGGSVQSVGLGVNQIDSETGRHGVSAVQCCLSEQCPGAIPMPSLACRSFPDVGHVVF